MALRNRSTKTSYIDEINSQGTATQVELDNAIQNHITTFHNNEAIEYYFDSVRNAYLSTDTFFVTYFEKNKNRNRYMYRERSIRSNYSLYRPYNCADYVLIGYQLTLGSPVGGGKIEIRDLINNITVHTISTNSTSKEVTNLNIQLTTGKVAAFIGSKNLNLPILQLAFKKKVNI